jgi:hypothetical protein
LDVVGVARRLRARDLGVARAAPVRFEALAVRAFTAPPFVRPFALVFFFVLVVRVGIRCCSFVSLSFQRGLPPASPRPGDTMTGRGETALSLS